MNQQINNFTFDRLSRFGRMCLIRKFMTAFIAVMCWCASATAQSYFFQDFNTNSNGVTGSSYWDWSRSNSGGVDNSGCLSGYVSSSSSISITTTTSVAMGTSSILSFRYKSTATVNTLQYTVSISTDGGVTFPTNLLLNERHDVSDDFKRVSVNVSAYTGQTIMVRITFAASTAGSTIYFDDFAVGTVPAIFTGAAMMQVGEVYNNYSTATVANTRTYKIFNNGNQPLTVSAGATTGGISFTGLPTTVPAFGSTTINVVIDATSFGTNATYNGSFTLNINEPNRPTVTTNVTGTVRWAIPDFSQDFNTNSNGVTGSSYWDWSRSSSGGVDNSGCLSGYVSNGSSISVTTSAIAMGANPNLSFKYKSTAASNYLQYSVEISKDGETWTYLYQNQPHSYSENFVSVNRSLSNDYANQIVWVRITFSAQTSTYVYLDDVCIGLCSSTPSSLTVSSSSLNFIAAGEQKTFTVTSNTSWTVSSDAPSWLTVSPTSGSNNGTITVSATANTSTSQRTATITVSGTGVSSRTISVTQTGSVSSCTTTIVSGTAGDNIVWELCASGTLIISGMGAMKNWDSFYPNAPWHSYRNSITSVIVENGVTSIGNYAFDDCIGLQTTIIPNSVTSIGRGAFYGCTGLQSITIPNSVTSIDIGAFYNCTGLRTVNFNAINCTSMDMNGVFSGCSSFTILNIGNEVTIIPDNAFKNCTNLKTVNFNAINCTTMGNNVWRDCSSFTTLNIGNNVTNIPSFAFYDCSSLTGITIPNSVTSIGNDAFRNCSSLTEIIIPKSVTSIGTSAFDNCTSLEIVNFNATNCTYMGNCSLGVFGSSFTTLNIGNGVAIIPDLAFSGSTSLETVTISNSVTSIGRSAFSGCRIKEITIPNSVKNIGDAAFWGCSNLIEVAIPNNVTSIGYGAFFNCNSLTNVSVNWITPLAVDSGIFYSVPLANVKLHVPEGSECAYGSVYPWSAFNLSVRCRQIGSPNAPDVVAIQHNDTLIITGTGAMQDFDYYASPWFYSPIRVVIIEEGVTRIGKFAFSAWQDLTEVTIPNSVTSIGSDAFADCSSLTDITIPKSVTSIGDAVFWNCTSLETVNFNATNMGQNVFNGCTSITTLNIGNDIPDAAFLHCTSLKTVIIGNSVTNIGRYAFCDCSNLTNITIPNSVTNIGGAAFQDCTSLETVTIGNSVTNIGNSAFADCSNLKEVTIGNSVTSIEPYAFSECTALTDVIVNCTTPPLVDDYRIFYNVSLKNVKLHVPEGSECAYSSANVWKYFNLPTRCIGSPNASDVVATLRNDTLTITGTGAMQDFDYLASPWSDYGITPKPIQVVIIEEGVTSIGEYAFALCSSLKEVTIGESVTSIGKSAFYSCRNLKEITIPESVTSIEGWAFQSCDGLTDVWVNWTTPLAIEWNTFNDVLWSEINLHVPDGSECAYSSADVWSGFKRLSCASSALVVDSDNQLKISPNPAKNEISIQSDLPIEKVEICDMAGRTVGVEYFRPEYFRPAQGNGVAINISHLPNGLYILKVYTGKGVAVSKVVKE